MYRAIVGITLAIALSGCGLAARQAQQERLLAAQAEVKRASEACITRFSESNQDAIPRAKCLNDADAAYGPTTRFPDLVSLRMAKRMELAEKQSTGKITRPQAVLEMAQLNSAGVAEEQRRTNANQSVAAQQQAATAATIGALSANAPRTCTSVGNTVNCY
jgi:hypothetical protein